ncbi:hypothetical protein ACMGD3_07525 [Lysinibacillus sphaericus]|uniref:hypothetical protein n=1 Tax=Lysinibacillus sphaericus TaxID=1421 RepID=UPI003F7A624F
MAANKTKSVSLLAYQFDLHKIEKKDTRIKGKKVTIDSYKIKWDSSIISKFVNKYNDLKKNDEHMILKEANFLVLLEEFKEETDYFYGKFTNIEHGTVSPLLDATTLVRRSNPKKKTEGEEQYTHFAIRKKDGLMHIQFNLRMHRNKIQEFFEKHFKDILLSNGYTDLNLCILLSTDFLEDIRKLDTIKGTQIEITSKIQSDENEFIQSVQDQMNEVESNCVSLFFKARYKNNTLKDVVPFINNYNGKKGVTSIKVHGFQGTAEKTINTKSASEKIKFDVKIDGDGNFISQNLYDECIKATKNRPVIQRGLIKNEGLLQSQ